MTTSGSVITGDAPLIRYAIRSYLRHARRPREYQRPSPPPHTHTHTNTHKRPARISRVCAVKTTTEPSRGDPGQAANWALPAYYPIRKL